MIIQRRNRLGLKGRVVAFDTETTGLHGRGPWKKVEYNWGNALKPNIEVRKVAPARPFLFLFCDEEGNTRSVRFKVDPKTREVIYDRRLRDVAEIIEDEKMTKVAHNGRFDMTMCELADLTWRGPIIETLILTHLRTAGGELTYALKPLAKKYLQIPDSDEKDLQKAVNRARLDARRRHWAYATGPVFGKSPSKADYWLAPHELCDAYGEGDVIRAMLFKMKWYDECMADKRERAVYDREHELFWVLKRMEDRGTRVYPNVVRDLKDFYHAYQRKQMKIVLANGGEGLNVNSTPQMSATFYETRGHVPNHTGTTNKKTRKLNYSLTGDHLLAMATGYTTTMDRLPDYVKGTKPVPSKMALARYGYERDDDDRHTLHRKADPLAKAMLEHKAAGQTVGTFLEVYERLWVRTKEYFDEMEQIIYLLHPNFKQTGARTGRLSCSDPNLMQVASETTGRRKAEIQSKPRQAFGPRPGYMWYLPDYSQIEVWLFAFLGNEKSMKKILLSGEHYHTTIAREVFGKRKDFDAHMEYYVKCAKLIMFCKLYGGGAKKMASLLKMGIDKAMEFIEQFDARLPGVKGFMSEMIHKAKTDGVIYNPFGRRYEFEEDFAYRAVNYFIQGTAADVMKNALINVDKMLRKKYPNVHLLLTIHDEIIIEGPIATHSVRLMQDIMIAMQMDSKRLGIPRPLPVKMKTTKTFWHEAKEVDVPVRKFKLVA